MVLPIRIPRVTSPAACTRVHRKVPIVIVAHTFEEFEANGFMLWAVLQPGPAPELREAHGAPSTTSYCPRSTWAMVRTRARHSAPSGSPPAAGVMRSIAFQGWLP